MARLTLSELYSSVSVINIRLFVYDMRRGCIHESPWYGWKLLRLCGA